MLHLWYICGAIEEYPKTIGIATRGLSRSKPLQHAGAPWSPPAPPSPTSSKWQGVSSPLLSWGGGKWRPWGRMPGRGSALPLFLRGSLGGVGPGPVLYLPLPSPGLAMVQAAPFPGESGARVVEANGAAHKGSWGWSTVLGGAQHWSWGQHREDAAVAAAVDGASVPGLGHLGSAGPSCAGEEHPPNTTAWPAPPRVSGDGPSLRPPQLPPAAPPPQLPQCPTRGGDPRYATAQNYNWYRMLWVAH